MGFIKLVPEPAKTVALENGAGCAEQVIVGLVNMLERQAVIVGQILLHGLAAPQVAQ